MPVDEETKRRIIDLHSNERISVREIAKIVKKSSRDIIAVLKVSENKEKADETMNIQGNNMPVTKEEKGDTEYELPPNIKAYKLFSEGKSLVEVTIELELTAQQAQQFNTEYWKLMQMNQLFIIYQEVKNNLGYFLKLFRLGKKEGLTPENIISFLNMADSIQDLSEQFRPHLNDVKALELRKNRCKERLEDLENKTISAQEQLSDTDRACKQKFDELTGICTQIRMLEYQIEQFKNSQSYQAIEQVAKDKVSEFLADNKRLLEHALVSVIKALRNDPDRYLLIEKMSVTTTILDHGRLDVIMENTFAQGYGPYVRKKVLELAGTILNTLQKNIVDNVISTVAGFDKESDVCQALPYHTSS
jgi:hypothetical protein